ncbi:MAG: DUF2934 domain-containing protein [Verrucomicrobiaceae bacterium]|nr:DUF2934 domain-containing protein [Verrucomicrobiaceae bacterium]
MKPAKKTSAAAKTPVKTAPKSAATPKKKNSRATKPPRERQQADASSPLPEITEADIATSAYFLYVNEGCPAGREMDHWLEAEARLLGR